MIKELDIIGTLAYGAFFLLICTGLLISVRDSIVALYKRWKQGRRIKHL